MTEKRFYVDDKKHIIENNGYRELNKYAFNNKTDWKGICKRLNEQHEYMGDLIRTLNIYRKKMNCNNCKHHDYDWFDDGDEFEVCNKGNIDGLTMGFCEDWRELE